MRWLWVKRAPLPVALSKVEKAVIANGLGVATRDIGEVQKVKKLATNNGLLAGLRPEDQAWIAKAFNLARDATGSSQSQPVPGRQRAARTLKLSTHGGAK